MVNVDTTPNDDKAAAKSADVEDSQEAAGEDLRVEGLGSAATGPIFWSALAVSAVLVALGFISLRAGLVDFTTSQLILCSGLGILFGAFGSMATVKYKGVVVAGVAAIAIVLLGTVNYLISDDYVIIKIGGDTLKAKKVDMYGEKSYYGAPTLAGYDFIVLRRDLQLRSFSLLIESSEAQEADATPREYIFECLQRERLLNALGSVQAVEWRFDRSAGVLREWDGTKIADVGPCRPADEPAAPRFSLERLLGVGTAFAQTLPDVGVLVSDLESESTVARRDSRAKLAALGPAIVPALASHLLKPDVSYRARIGIIVAYTEMLREHKSERLNISATIDDALLEALVKASADPDRTVRIYASEFLYDLGDPRSAQMALNVFPEANDDGKYNLILVIQGAYPFLATEQKDAADNGLRSIYATVGPNTQELIRRINPDLASS